MLKESDFENIIWDFLFTHRQFLLNANLHKQVNSEVYNKNIETWNTLLLSLETGVVLGLAKLLEENFFGRKFDSEKLNLTSKRIINIRKGFLAHNDLSKMRNKASFLGENQLTGSDLIEIIDALKQRAIQYQNKFNVQIDVQELFNKTTENAMSDLNDWLKFFKAT